MRQNNFKELEQILAKNKDFTFQKVKSNLVETKSLFSFIGDMIEHFIPKIMDVFIGMAGGNNSEKTNYPHEGGVS